MARWRRRSPQRRRETERRLSLLGADTASVHRQGLLLGDGPRRRAHGCVRLCVQRASANVHLLMLYPQASNGSTTPPFTSSFPLPSCPSSHSPSSPKQASLSAMNMKTKRTIRCKNAPPTHSHSRSSPASPPDSSNSLSRHRSRPSKGQTPSPNAAAASSPPLPLYGRPTPTTPLSLRPSRSKTASTPWHVSPSASPL